MNDIVIVGEFSIGEKHFEIKKTETPDKVSLFITDKGMDRPMSGSQLGISKEKLSVCQ